MQNQFSRTQLLLGEEAMAKLATSRVAVFGIGGVGGYVTEVLARSGVGAIDIIDNDTVCESNLNRQIIALHSTIGRRKVDVMEERIRDINPACKVTKHPVFYLPESHLETNGFEPINLDFTAYDYVVDCIDTITAKIDLVCQCHKVDTPILSSMGAANKMDPTAFRVADLFQTSIDPLAKILRKKLRKMGITQLKVVYSEEIPLTHATATPANQTGSTADSATKSHRPIPASNAFVPAAAGLIAGGEVVKDLISWQANTH